MFISPMLLQKADQPYNDEKYLTELKLDGFRCIYTKFNNKVKIYTRHNNEVTSMFPELLNLAIPDNTALDGEIIVSDARGRPDFEAVMERFRSKKTSHQITYCVFDIIYFNGEKVTFWPLIERKVLLAKVIPEDSSLLTKVQWTEGNGVAYFNLVKENDLEGVVHKRADSNYQINKRSADWLKVINYQETDAIILGLRKKKFGLLLGIEDKGRIKPAGVMEFMNPAARKQFYSQYKDLIVEEDQKNIFIKPELKCKVKFRNYTKNGYLRIPSFIKYIS